MKYHVLPSPESHQILLESEIAFNTQTVQCYLLGLTSRKSKRLLNWARTDSGRLWILTRRKFKKLLESAENAAYFYNDTKQWPLWCSGFFEAHALSMTRGIWHFHPTCGGGTGDGASRWSQPLEIAGNSGDQLPRHHQWPKTTTGH